MKPFLAIAICTIYILYLLYFEKFISVDKDKTLSTIVCVIWISILSSRMVSLWFLNNKNLGTNVYLEGSSLDRNIFIILILISIFCLIKYRIKWTDLLRNNRFLFIFFFFCFLSVLWSDYPFIAFKRYIKEIGSLLIAIIILSNKDTLQSILSVFRKCSYILVPLSIALFKYFPEYGRVYHRFSGELTITGVTTNKNSLGVLCSISCICLFWSFFSLKNSIKYRIVLINIFVVFSMSFWLLIKSNSKTSLFCFLLSIILYFCFQLSFVKNRSYSIGTIITIFITITGIIIFTTDLVTFLVEDIIGRDLTLTGRTMLWQDLIKHSDNNLWGYGFNSFWLGDRIQLFWDKYWWNPTQSHNGYLEIYLNLGIIGLSLFTILIISSFNRVTEDLSLDYQCSVFRINLFVYALVYNITEATFLVFHLVWFILLLSLIKTPKIIRTDSTKDFH